MKVMITGGAGYLGSHACVELIRAGYSTVLFDDFSNSHPEVVNRIHCLTGVLPAVVRGDIRDRGALTRTLVTHRCGAVLHFAGLKSVPDSIRRPLVYRETNIGGTDSLIRSMADTGVHRLVFASTAAVYGQPIELPIKEDHPLLPSNPYGQTKLVVEQMLDELSNATDLFRIAVLRFFNPVGAHASGLIGEDPRGEPDNLMPHLSQVAIGRRPHLKIFGNDYDTADGTAVRDYVHVMDIAAAHIRALECLEQQRLIKVNLGTGRGHSILELVETFSKVTGINIAHVLAPRREGDIAQCYASATLAQQKLGWCATRSLADMCRDTWRWQSMNPGGYADVQLDPVKIGQI
jgi:UDP-glucose 4-epimerase